MSKFGETPDFSAGSLCRTCRNGQVVKGRKFNEHITYCHSHGTDSTRITYQVASCTDYDDKRIPSLWQLEKIAWRFSIDNKKKTTGFYRPDDWKNKLKCEGKEDDEIEVPF